MKKFVTISANTNPEYCFFLPFIILAWQKLGWHTATFFVSENYNDYHQPHAVICRKYAKEASQLDFVSKFHDMVADMPPYRHETLVQCIRFYGHRFSSQVGEANLYMTSDADMLPLSDYWQPKFDDITCYGRDLTDYHYPICYIAMNAKHWNAVLGTTTQYWSGHLRQTLDSHPKAASTEWNHWWQVDQDIITEKINNFGTKPVLIDRGIASNTHYPKGRIDRGDWKNTNLQTAFIDAHLPRPGYHYQHFDQIITLMKEKLVFNDYTIHWLTKYRNEFVAALPK